MKTKIVTTIIVLIIMAFNANAQTTANPDTVCAGSNTYYKIQSPTTGSTYIWGVFQGQGAITSGTGTDSIRIQWDNTTGTDSLWVSESNAANCMGDIYTLVVERVAQPTAEFDNATLCFGESLNVNFTGYPPFSIEYTANGNTVTQSDIVQNPFSVGGTAGNYILVGVTDKHCGNNAPSGTITAVIGQQLQELQIIHD